MKQDELILEAPCRVPAGLYMRRAMRLWLSRHWWWIALLLVACASLAVVDARWSVIAFILVVAALMMVMSLVYFHHVFSPLARWSVMEKTVTVTRQGLDLAFEHPRMNAHHVEWESVRSIDFATTATVLHIAGGAINFLMLPPVNAQQAAIVKRLYLGK